MSQLGHFRLPTARLRSCSGASTDPQKADHIRAPALVVSRVPGSDIAVDHVPFLGEALVERRARPC